MASSSPTTSNTSVSQFVSTLIFNLVIFTIFLSLFVLLRKKNKRVYEPRHIVETVPKNLQTDEPPAGPFSWLPHLLKQPESFLIQHAGIDGYFFIRFLFEFSIICTVGAILIFPILFSVNATGGNQEKGFDILSFSNVKNENRFFAHIFLSWFFFGLVIFVIYRELVYYVSFRHVAQTTPMYDSLLSSRTILLTELPDELLEEHELRTLFPAASNIWYARDYKELQDKVKERTKLAKKYENTLVKVISKSVKTKNKLVKKEKPLPEDELDLTSWIKKRPTHRLKFLRGEKVDTLNYGVSHMDELTKEINEEQSNFLSNDMVGSVFIEFDTQLECQRAYQAIPFHKLLKKARRYIGYAPSDIVWENLAVSKYVRHSKRTVAKTLLTLTIIFWAIPVAVVGAISNINLLIDKVHFLKFIDNLPKPLMGLITGILPTVALAVLMSLLPPYIKKMGKIGGCISTQDVQLWCHDWYYAFQVVQVFLVATIASSASSVVTSIVENPGSAMSLLSGKLPKAANFYISYILLQGLSVSSGALAQIVALILSKVIGRILDKTPRAKWNRYNNMSQPDWSTIYPVFQLLALIAICYSIIAPLILAFTAVAFILIWVAYIYNLNYVMIPNKSDARGRNYPKALFQIFVALYLAEVTLIALFVFSKNWAAVVLEALICAATVLSHLYFQRIFIPLFDVVPVSILAAKDGSFVYPIKDLGLKEIKETGKNYFENLGINIDINDINDSTSTKSADEQINGNGEVAINNDLKDDEKDSELHQSDPFRDEKVPSSSVPAENIGNEVEFEQSGLKIDKSWAVRFFKPKQSENITLLKNMMPSGLSEYISYDERFIKTAYVDPAVSDEEPKIWIAKDPIGLSGVEIEKAEGKVFVTDDNAIYNEKGKVLYVGPPPDYEEAVRV